MGEIIDGRAAVTAEMSLQLRRFFGQPNEYWLNLQTTCDHRRASACADSIPIGQIVVVGDQPSIEALARRGAEWSAELNRRPS